MTTTSGLSDDAVRMCSMTASSCAKRADDAVTVRYRPADPERIEGGRAASVAGG